MVVTVILMVIVRDRSTPGRTIVGLLQREVIDGTVYWHAAESPPIASIPARVHLLQAYDEYLVAYSESKYILDSAGVARSRPAQGGLFNHVLIVDGQVAGRWRRTQQVATVVIEVALFAEPGGPWIRALHEAAERHGRFLGRSARLLTSVRDPSDAR